jgi:hypothetical protein
MLAASIFLGILYKILDDVEDPNEDKPDKVKTKVKFYIHILARICMFVVYFLAIIRLNDKTLVSIMATIQTISGALIILRTK